MSEHYRALPADLDAHARNLGGVAGRIDQVATAAGSVNLGTETFGIIGEFFNDGAVVQSARATECIAALREALANVAGGLTETAATYRGVEDANATTFEGGS
ncbi:MAG: type VII secretion target [Pseudonocardiaceae bacterium]